MRRSLSCAASTVRADSARSCSRRSSISLKVGASSPASEAASPGEGNPRPRRVYAAKILDFRQSAGDIDLTPSGAVPTLTTAGVPPTLC